MNYLTVPLNSSHERENFNSGTDVLDRYFKLQAKQDVKRRLSACFVYEDVDSQAIIGFYTLSGSSLPKEVIPDTFCKRLPKSYTSNPVILLGRIAVDLKYQGKGIGKLLLIDALKRCFDASVSVGAFAVIVDPIDSKALEFYERFGFIELPDSGKMFLPVQTIKELFE